MTPVRKHLTDEQILAHVDGETGLWERYRVRLHLFACWQCHARLLETKEAMRRTCEAYRAQGYLARQDVEEARRRWIEQVMEGVKPAPRPPAWPALRRRSFSTRWAALALALAAAAAVITLPVRHEVRELETAAVPPVSRSGAPREPITAPAVAPALPVLKVPDVVLKPPPPARFDLLGPQIQPPRPPNLDLIEARVLFALHSLGTCRGEPVRLERSADGLRLTGYTTPERREEIADALNAAGLGTMVVLGVHDWELDPAEPAPLERSVVIPVPAPRRIVLEPALREYFRSRGITDPDRLRTEITNYATQAFQFSEEAQIEASALFRLAGRWGDAARLDREAGHLLVAMAASHASGLQKSLTSLALLLEPVFGQAPPEPAPPPESETGSWTEMVRQLRLEVNHAHRLVAALFAGDRLPEDTPEQEAPSLLLERVHSLCAVPPVLEQRARAEIVHARRRDP